MKLPISRQTVQTSTLAVTCVQSVIEQHAWIFRRQDGIADFGIDAEIEIVDRNKVTGKLCKCQVKGTERVDWDDHVASVQVSVSTFNLWKSTHLPVIVFLVDVTRGIAYWATPLQHHPRPGADSITMKFLEDNSINDSFGPFEDFLESWYASFPADKALREVSYYDTIFEELIQAVDGGDPWMQVGEDMDRDTRLFYRHLLQLRASLGLSNADLPPLDFWYIRNAAIWDDDFELFYAVFSELMSYAKVYYREALEKLLARLPSIEECFENQELINFYRRKNNDRDNVFLAYRDERFDDLRFHKEMEDKLKIVGALRYSYSDRRAK